MNFDELIDVEHLGKLTHDTLVLMTEECQSRELQFLRSFVIIIIYAFVVLETTWRSV